MADADKKTADDQVVDKAPDKTKTENIGAAPKPAIPKMSAGKWALVALVVFFAALGLCASTMAAVRLATHRLDRDGLTVARFSTSGPRLSGDQDLEAGDMMGGRMRNFGGNYANSASRVTGVVTAVSGDSITVAGDGTTTKVVVSSDTTYVGSSQPAAVNDTIVVTGTKSGDTFTAATVRLIRQ